ncbi:hypothetical protein ABK040_008257 [Willaertia magna]
MNEYLKKFSSTHPHVADTLEDIKNDYDKKMWHNISDKILNLVTEDQLSGLDLVDLYKNFISSFELRINSLKLGKLIVEISKKLPIDYHNDGYNFVESINDKLQKKDKEASCILKSEMAYWKLKGGDLSNCKKLLEQTKETITELGFVDNYVNACYYKVYANYLKLMDDPNEFYKNQLLYLAYTKIEDVPLIEQQSIAFDLGIAALLGDAIYNFGEFLQHPIVESLNGTQAEWLYRLLKAFNRGDIKEYEQLMNTYQNEINSRPALSEKKEFLYEKVQLMCLMELVFSKPAHDRNIHFSEVNQITGKSEDEVEPLLLKALSYDLIRGVIDGVQQSIHVRWAQPRVLDKDQIGTLRDKLGTWLDKVDESLKFLKQHGSEDVVETEEL